MGCSSGPGGRRVGTSQRSDLYFSGNAELRSIFCMSQAGWQGRTSSPSTGVRILCQVINNAFVAQRFVEQMMRN